MSMEGETLVVPPDKESDDWHVYLINGSSDAEGKGFDFYYSQPKTLLFEGKIQDFLQEDCVITPKEISSSSQQADISDNPFYQPL